MLMMLARDIEAADSGRKKRIRFAKNLWILKSLLLVQGIVEIAQQNDKSDFRGVG